MLSSDQKLWYKKSYSQFLLLINNVDLKAKNGKPSKAMCLKLLNINKGDRPSSNEHKNKVLRPCQQSQQVKGKRAILAGRDIVHNLGQYYQGIDYNQIFVKEKPPHEKRVAHHVQIDLELIHEDF